MRRCDANLIVCSGRIFLVKLMLYFDKYDALGEQSPNPCQPSWFALLREATKRQQRNVCTGFVLKVAHPRQKHL